MPSERNHNDLIVSHIIGVGATRIEERQLAASQRLEHTPILFEACQSVPQAGVLFLLPFLEEAGLFSYKNHFSELTKGYYNMDIIVLFLALMYLRRIKNPEQLKYHSPGEFGKIIGLDRVPEAKCLRGKLKQICEQNKSEQWNMDLAGKWASTNDNEFYYIDGHVQVYSGYNATLGKKHVSRQKLCLPGMQEFWVNDHKGMPYFYVTGQVNEKLLEMLDKEIIPKLLHEMPAKYTKDQLEQDPQLPRFTIVFDREAYSPVFFDKLWKEHRIAVITYRKNVKDQWDESEFEKLEVEIEGIKTEMALAENKIELNDIPMREIRKLSGKHQTSVITTNKKLSQVMVAVYMFSRWTQENFFKYLRQDYDFDRLLQYSIEQLDKELFVNNPEYNNYSYHIKKVREKISRRKAVLYELQESNVKDNLDNTKKYIQKQTTILQQLEELVNQEGMLIEQRSCVSSRIKIGQMPENIKYNKLNTESKRFQNIIKIICYRAETSFANLFSDVFRKHINEKRAIVKTIINSLADLQPDHKNNTLTVKLYSLTSPRLNKAIEEICVKLNQTKTIYPGTNLAMKFKIAT